MSTWDVYAPLMPVTASHSHWYCSTSQSLVHAAQLVILILLLAGIYVENVLDRDTKKLFDDDHDLEKNTILLEKINQSSSNCAAHLFLGMQPGC